MNAGVFFFVGLGAVLVAAGLAHRFGAWPPRRRRAKWYHTVRRNPDLPRHLRHGMTGLVPLGIGFALLGAVVPLISRNVFLALALLGVALLVMLLGPVVTPARWLEPAWMREEERREREGLRSTLPTPPEGRRLVVSPRQYWAMWVALVAFAVAALALGLHPPAVVVAVIGAIPWLIAIKRRKPARGTDELPSLGGGRSSP